MITTEPGGKNHRYHASLPWFDRVTDDLLGIAGLLSMLEIPVCIWLAMGSVVRPGSLPLPRELLRWLLVPPVFVDLSSAYLNVIYLVWDRGTHGQAVISWFCYVLFAFFLFGGAWWWRIPAAVAGFTVFHLCCHYYLPPYVAKRLGWQPPEGVDMSFWGWWR